jgi:hypothetical protein
MENDMIKYSPLYFTKSNVGREKVMPRAYYLASPG